MPFPGRLRALPAFVGTATWLALATPGLGQSLIPQKDFYVTDNVVEVVEVIGDSVYVGGRFTHVGRYTGPLAPLSVSTGATLPGFPEANDLIFGLASDGAGGWFVGGDFTEIGGMARSRVAHLLPDLTVDPAWDPGASHRVYGFAIHDSIVYMHGFFLTVGGQTRNRLAAVDLATGAVTAWDPNPTNGLVEDFHLDGDILYVAGSFSTIAGESRSMAAFDLTTGTLTAFDPVIPNNVLTVVARDGVVYVGGRFSAAGGATRNRLAAFDAATSALLPWDPDVNGLAVYDLALGDSTVFVGGSFSNLGGEIHPALAEVSLASGNPLNTIGGTIGQIYAVLVHGDSLYVGGDFTTLDSQDRRYLGGFDLATGNVLDTPSPLTFVNVLAASGDTLFVGGEFGAVAGVDRNRFAAFRASTLELLPWAPDFQDIVWDIEGNAAGDTLYVSGRFLSVDGAAREKVASFELATGSLTALHANVNGDVYGISVTDSLLYLGGTYSMVGAQFRADLASVNRVTGNLTPWNPGSSGFVNTIQAWNDTVYVGGVFSTIGDSSRANLAAVDGVTGDVLGWGSSISLGGTDEVESFFPLDHPSYPSGALFIGGDFLNLGIGLRRGVATLHRDTGNTLYNWNPFLGPSFECEVRDFALADGLLYIVGDFDGVLLNDAMDAAAIDVVTGDANSWIVTAVGANAIAVSDSMVFVGGGMSKVQGYRLTNLAAFRRDTDPPLAASALVATPGTVDKRIDLSWAASPSPDVKDYLVYRTTAAGADTTNRQIGVSTATTSFDITPSYAEWFYRVFARDEAHNIGPASNEDSAVSPQVVAPTPDITTAIHQNPVLSRYADVVVVSDSLLMQVPVVSIEHVSDTTAVAMAFIPGSSSAYRGPWEIVGSGLHTVRTSVVTAGGDPFDFERDFSATLVQPGPGGEVASASGLAVVRIPARLLRGATYFLVEEIAADMASPTVRLGPLIPFDRNVALELTYDPAQSPDPGKLFVARLEGGSATLLPSEVFPERGVVRTHVDRLGEFGLVQAPGFGGDNTVPIRFAVHANRPNPFRGSTNFRYDLPEDRPVRVAIYDVQGRRLLILQDGFEKAGRHTVVWDGRNSRGAPVAAGVYFARVTAGEAGRILKMVVLR